MLVSISQLRMQVTQEVDHYFSVKKNPGIKNDEF